MRRLLLHLFRCLLIRSPRKRTATPCPYQPSTLMALAPVPEHPTQRAWLEHCYQLDSRYHHCTPHDADPDPTA
jgi:hypothetical protein